MCWHYALYPCFYWRGSRGRTARFYSMWSNFWFLNLEERKRANTGIKRHLSNGPPVENYGTHTHTYTHSSLDFKSQRWRSCIWLWAKTWKNEFMLGLVCFCYLLIRKIPVLWLFNAATLHLYYLLYSNCFTWFHLKDKYRNIDYFFLCLFTFLSFLSFLMHKPWTC